MVKSDDDDFVTSAGVVNIKCEKFKLNEITPYLFKFLIFVQALTSNEDAEIRSRKF